MVENNYMSRIAKPPEKCPDCNADVRLKSEYANGDRQLVLYNLDGTLHDCQKEEQHYEKHPIGQAVIGGVIKGFQLRGRRLTITLEDGNVLSVSAAGKPLSLQLEGPGGIVQE